MEMNFNFLEPQLIQILLVFKNYYVNKKTNFSILIFVFIEQIDLCVQQLMEEAVILISLYNCILYINIIIQMIPKNFIH